MLNQPCISIQVQSVYIESQSEPDASRYVFAYTMSIRNLGRKPVKLLTRYWLITNSDGHTTEVQGEGVVGEQPTIYHKDRISLYQRRSLRDAARYNGRALHDD